MQTEHKKIPCLLGVDFDNTIVSYDVLMSKRAQELGLIAPGAAKDKKAIRDAIRRLPDGEKKWQRLQAFAYGKGMDKAVMFEGVKDFFRACKRQGICVYVVSHKTKFATLNEDGTNLRETALNWMEKNRFFENDGLGLTHDQVYFESTPDEKIKRIKQLGCTHFIDDLEELFLNPSFPEHVEKILFAPLQERPSLSIPKTLSAWSEIEEYFRMYVHNGLTTAEIGAVEKLLGESVVFSEKIAGGSNSRVYRLRSERGQHYAAKFYFHQDADTRDRLETEFSSLSFLWEHGLRGVPEPVAVDKDKRCAVYQYIEGTKIRPHEVTADDVDCAIRFLGQLKMLAGKKESGVFHPASEACFSIRKIIENIEWRLKRLHKVAAKEPLRGFLEDELMPFFSILKDWCLRKAAESATPFDADIRMDERTLSPSDFGFHNALKDKNGNITFFDFEYFGWDDPAKMISDFLLHPAMTMDKDLKLKFMNGMGEVFGNNKNLFERVEIVYPLFGFKWCLIFLNEFIPGEMQRRNFAQGNPDNQKNLQMEQMAKARKMLDFVKGAYQDFPYKLCVR